MANLQKRIDLLDVDAIVVSHRHFDHFLDLYPYFLARRYHLGQRPDPVPLYAPPGMFEHALQLEAELTGAYDPREVELGRSFRVGPFRIETAPMAHPVPTLGMRIEADGSVLAYSADTGPTDELVGLAREADLLLCECTWLERPATAPPFHLTPEEAGRLAARAGAAKVLVTHIWPAVDRETVRQRVAEAFGGPAVLAWEGMEITLPAPDSSHDSHDPRPGSSRKTSPR